MSWYKHERRSQRIYSGLIDGGSAAGIEQANILRRGLGKQKKLNRQAAVLFVAAKSQKYVLRTMLNNKRRGS